MYLEGENLIKFVIDRACLRKVNLTEEQANRVVDIEASQGRLLYFYKCEFCNSFHMTSREGEVEKQLTII